MRFYALREIRHTPSVLFLLLTALPNKGDSKELKSALCRSLHRLSGVEAFCLLLRRGQMNSQYLIHSAVWI